MTGEFETEFDIFGFEAIVELGFFGRCFYGWRWFQWSGSVEGCDEGSCDTTYGIPETFGALFLQFGLPGALGGDLAIADGESVGIEVSAFLGR